MEVRVRADVFAVADVPKPRAELSAEAFDGLRGFVAARVVVHGNRKISIGLRRQGVESLPQQLRPIVGEYADLEGKSCCHIII